MLRITVDYLDKVAEFLYQSHSSSSELSQASTNLANPTAQIIIAIAFLIVVLNAFYITILGRNRD